MNVEKAKLLILKEIAEGRWPYCEGLNLQVDEYNKAFKELMEQKYILTAINNYWDEKIINKKPHSDYWVSDDGRRFFIEKAAKHEILYDKELLQVKHFVTFEI